MLLTAAIAFTSLIASAQFMITADLDLEDFSTDSITETTDFGFGYMINDTWTVGATIPAGSSLELIDGGSKIVLVSGDALKVDCDTDNALDVWCSVVDTISE